jgi:predicted acetyltransferase
MTAEVRPLTGDDLGQISQLSQLAFGYRSDTLPPLSAGMLGIDGPDGRLHAFARIRSYSQWWGGRRVPMGGIASVAVHPDGRGRGLARTLMTALLPVMRESGQPISVLFPTGLRVYRPVGYEVVGSLDDTTLETRDLEVAERGGATVRTATRADAPAIAGLYAGLAATVNGLLTRDGPEFPAGAEAVLDSEDVVALAETVDGDPIGYATYSRGEGYRAGSQLRVWECVAATAPGAAALLRSLASWSTVARTVRWRGPTDELQLHLGQAVPPPSDRQPWMLRIVDAPQAIALRGFPAGVSADARFVLHDPDVAEHSCPWRLVVEAGRGRLERVEASDALPQLHVRGLALLYAGAADTAGLQRAGLLGGALPGVDAAFTGRSHLRDYF